MAPSRKSSKGVRSLGVSLATLGVSHVQRRYVGKRISNAKVAELQSIAVAKTKLLPDRKSLNQRSNCSSLPKLQRRL